MGLIIRKEIITTGDILMYSINFIYLINMFIRQKIFFLIGFLILHIGCDKGCDDTKACNYGVSKEDCKYADEEEELLTGSWDLVAIYDSNEICIFSSSSSSDCDLDGVLSSINITFNDDNTCLVVTSPSEFSDPLPVGDWSINICENMLNFSNNDSGYDPYVYFEYLPFGNQIIIKLSSSTFICEDLAGNVLYWEKT